MTKDFLEKACKFDAALKDGRFTQKATKTSNYNLRSAILMSKKLGRPLTSAEMNSFSC